ncbi:MAG TPA: sigma-70 family RNA polymerase sigma factor [Planctomycetaceae bacterium]|nr:sigma-70 family RNA polymerase sigma factor [Planctomycetaceae bacterium]HIQ21028.1 sigma-70 family RNA polymerase sigma factor [Planctomycetota bacterium]
MDNAAQEDRGLVARAKEGDFEAFEKLVSKYERRLFNLAMRIVRHRHDAEEVVQQTFLNVIQHLDQFRGDARFYTWLARIATNQALSLLRRESIRASLPLAEDRSQESYADLPHPEYIAQWRETPDKIASRRETRQILSEALEELDDKYRLVFLLRDVEGLSTAETAEALGITPSNVKVRLLRARLMLRERLTRTFGDEATRVSPGHQHS